ncbi:MAG: hypothetical protein HQL87_03500 [Magnetococcales bacterium]|nr:hypothetical protein [Magnetococcales bacterium]
MITGKSLKWVGGIVLVMGLGVVSSWAGSVQSPTSQAETGGAVQIQGNTDMNTTVQGGVNQNVEGSKNTATTNVGGVQGTVQVQGNTNVNTNVKGGVTNTVRGSGNDSQVNVGGVQGK